MSDQDIRVLNSLTRTLIDSHLGYEACASFVEQHPNLHAELLRRCNSRKALVKEFQTYVIDAGGQPATDGSAVGAVHRAFTRFSALFQDDVAAAASALDDGEEFLAEKLEDCLEYADLLPRTSRLLERALLSAREGEQFADRLDD